MLRRNTSDIAIENDVALRGTHLNLGMFAEWITGDKQLSLDIAPETAQRIAASVSAVADAIIDKQVIYGVTTGFGGMSNNQIDCVDASALQANLLSFLAAAAGPEIDACHTRGAMLLRANVLLQGKSGIRLEVIERMVKFLQADAIPTPGATGKRTENTVCSCDVRAPRHTFARNISGVSARPRDICNRLDRCTRSAAQGRPLWF